MNVSYTLFEFITKFSSMKAQWFWLSYEIVTWSRCGAVLHDVRLPLADGVQKGMRRRDNVVRHPAVLGHPLEKQRRRHTELWKVKIDPLGSSLTFWRILKKKSLRKKGKIDVMLWGNLVDFVLWRDDSPDTLFAVPRDRWTFIFSVTQ